MIRFETDNPAIEALFHDFMEKAFSAMRSPVVLPTLAKPAPTPEPIEVPNIHPGIQTNLFPGPKIPAGKTISVEPDVSTEHLEKKKRPTQNGRQRLCPEGFPEAWKKKAVDFISARKAFSIGDVSLGRDINPVHRTRFKNWLSDNDKVCIERLLHIHGHPYLFIPTWEDGGITRFAKNAITEKSRLAMVASGQMDKSELKKEEVKILQKLGVAI